MCSGTVDDASLRAMVEVSADGLAVLDRHGRFVSLNAAAARILGAPAEALLGQPAPFACGQEDRGRTSWTAPGGRRRDLEHRLAPAAGGGHVVWFSDVTDVLRQQERLTAITRAASSVADLGSLHATLDAVANEVVMTASIAAVQIKAIDDPRAEVRLLGMAGFGDAADFAERLSACRRLGARVRFMEAFESARPVVVLNRKPSIMADPAWAPLHAIMGYPDWDSFVSVPLVVRGRTLGVINAYYVPGDDPGPHSLAFLEAMADHAAVAIDTAALLAQTRSQAQLDERRRLARDLHDSVVQQLFSMRMQATALRAQADGADPARVSRGAEELAELSQTALADLRGLVFELRPLDLAERGLVDAVRAHAAGLEVRTGLAVHVESSPGLALTCGIDVQEDLYRIVQEALHNVVKHAGAGAAHVRFAAGGDGALCVEVTDDGSGPTHGPDGTGSGPATLGLVSMRERTQRWGGRLDAGPRPAGGWSVRVSLPAPDVASAAPGGAAMTSGTGPVPDEITIMVVDDHAIVRRGLQAYVDTVAALRVIGEAADGRHALDLLARWRTLGEPLPDVVLMDLQMPRMGGVEATEAITRDHPEVKVVVLTSFGEVERVHAALAAGAAGYLLKDAEPEEVAAAVRAAAAGEVHLDAAVTRQLTRRMTSPSVGLMSLTGREREILTLIAQGHSNRDIADLLVISERTARTHVSNVLSKLQLSSRTQAALLAVREGLILPPV